MILLPASTSPMDVLLNRTNQWNQSNQLWKSRSAYLFTGSVFSLLAAAYHTVALVKFPATCVKVIGSHLPLSDQNRLKKACKEMPKELAPFELLIHACKICAFAIDFFLCPIVGLIAPKWNTDLHKQYALYQTPKLVEKPPRKEVPPPPPPPPQGNLPKGVRIQKKPQQVASPKSLLQSRLRRIRAATRGTPSPSPKKHRACTTPNPQVLKPHAFSGHLVEGRKLAGFIQEAIIASGGVGNLRKPKSPCKRPTNRRLSLSAAMLQRIEAGLEKNPTS